MSSGRKRLSPVDDMAYIDRADYALFSSGADIPGDFNALVSRSEDMIDQLTQYRIKAQGFENLAPFVQAQVKKAVCAQCEYILNSGGLESVNGGGSQSVTIGKFSVSGFTSAQQGSCAVSPLAVQYLAPTGLLYTGMDVMT